MYAKLFGPPDDQVLVTLMHDEAGTMQVRVHYQVGQFVDVVALDYESTEVGLANARAAFERMDEAEARRGIAAARAEQPGARWRTACESPAFLDELPPGALIPTHFTLVHARELYGLQLGETLEDAVLRTERERNANKDDEPTVGRRED